MRNYLRKSIASFNENKLRGLLAELDFRSTLTALGFADRVSYGGWLARVRGVGVFGHGTVALFPEIVRNRHNYSSARPLPVPMHGLHTICATLHQSAIRSFFCAAVVNARNDTSTMSWQCVQLGLPSQQSYKPISDALTDLNFLPRGRSFNFLRNDTNVSALHPSQIPEEFSKEHLRVFVASRFLTEMSDIDGLFWGQQFTYPIEIKEKTAAKSSSLGPYFGLDLGPFVKLSFYAASRGHLHALFVVREIDNVTDRTLVNWWFITFEKLALYASWVQQSGGTNMLGGGSAVVKVPRAEFILMNSTTLSQL
jgi:hypothetical protein